MPEKTTPDHFPFTKHLTVITKQYIGIVSEKLQSLEIDRAFYALMLIAEKDCQLTQQMLTDKLNTDKVCMVRTIDYLSRKGYARRKKNPDDRREHLLEVTEKGKAVIPKIRQVFYETNQEAFHGLSQEEITSFLQSLDIIKKNLDKIPAIDVRLNFNRNRKVKENT